ncbi:uncharacterized protein LOC107036521 [Diachasma alloeum]|uniref:uncharacterized protein LOC107036521 n=1 Tax=Diachasma alloeum TaxID=454923 RepID=UPI0007382C4B|nr:uncharacterized protein LOC107036521 [Diachasma alloeum]
MRFYAVLAALALVVISHAEANEAVNSVQDTIADTRRILEEYRLHLKNIQRYFIDLYQFRKENATSVADSSVQELQPNFEAAEELGKDANKCRKPLNVVVQRALETHMTRTNLCEDANLPNFSALRRLVGELLNKGDQLQSQVQRNVEGCKNETNYDGCLAERTNSLKASVLIWKSEVTHMRSKEATDTATAKRQMPLCLRASFTRFTLQLNAVNQIVRLCINALVEVSP